GDVGDEVPGPLAVADAADDPRGDLLHVVLEPLDHPRGEGPRDDPADLGVPGIVHVDHGAEVLVQVVRHVGDADRAAPGAEVLRAAGRLDHVGVPGERVVAGPGLHDRDGLVVV